MAKTLTEQIREHIENSGQSVYRLSLESGVGPSVLSRFLNEGTDMKLSTADKLAETLGLEIVQKKKSKKS